MSNIYLVALLVSNASGNVESIEAVDAVTNGGCTNKARQMYVASGPTPAGYELKFNCGTREALENVVANYNCRVLSEETKRGVVTTKYACDPSIKQKMVGWVKSVL